MSQISIIVKNIMRHGVLYVDDAVDFFRKKGQTFDQTLLVERVNRINKQPQKYGLPEGWIIGSAAMVVDGKVRRTYCMVKRDMYEKMDARSLESKRAMKRFKTA